MHTRPRILLFGAVLIAAASVSLAAHHSWPVSRAREVTVTGTVTAYTWGNPHVMIGLDVAPSAGAVEKWSVGGPSTTRMAGNGWDRNTLTPGDVITATGFQFADGSKILRLEKVVMPNGTEMFLYGQRR